MLKKTAQHHKIEVEELSHLYSQALLLKKSVSPERFITPDMERLPIQCPDHCHECCKVGVILDLTSVEALTVYLLNRELVELVLEYIDRHGETEFCPFMMHDRCVIHAYKPTACQMFMPFDDAGNPTCYYLAGGRDKVSQNKCFTAYLNSNAYDIHGFMLMVQKKVGHQETPSFFRNACEGVRWWKNHYRNLPEETKTCLASLLIESDPATSMPDFSIEEALKSGHEIFTDLFDLHHQPPS